MTLLSTIEMVRFAERPEVTRWDVPAVEDVSTVERTQIVTDPVLPRIAAGDDRAVDECLARYGGLVWSLCRRLSPSASDAEDAAQDVFIEIWKQACRFDARIAAESTFIGMIARRKLVDRHRRRGRSLETTSLGTETVVAVADNGPDPVELADDAARAAACLQRLKETPRGVIKMSIYQGLSYSAIAEQLQIPVGTVKTYARRSLLQLRDCMNGVKSPTGAGGDQL